MSTRWKTIAEIWQENIWLIGVVGWLIGLMTFPIIQIISTEFSTFLTDLVPEAFGIGFTVLIIERISANQARKQLQRNLVRLAGSRSNEIAKAAIDYMQHENWLSGRKSILRNADLSFANLQGARLIKANLEGANLEGANLKNAIMIGANLRQANLISSDLQDAKLSDSNLEKSDLDYADITRTSFAGANLRDANLLQARFDDLPIFEISVKDFPPVKATLPDGTEGEIGDEISRFFDPSHPNVFIPSWLDLEDRKEFW